MANIPTQNYPNPLDNFRTYSYHFIMTLTNNSQGIIDQIGGGTTGSTSNSPSPLLSVINNVTRPGQKVDIPQSNSNVYLILDSRRFSQYSITELSMTHSYGTGDIVNPTTPIAQHHMQLIDTTGISFFNMLMELFRNKIKSSRFSAFFLLGIMFVGHRDDGTTETISTTYIPMTILTLGLQFSSSGSTIEMTFQETEGGMARGGSGTNQIDYLGDVKSITTRGLPNTVGGMILALERDLNLASLDFYQKYNSAIASNDANSTSTQKNGKLVQYMITIPNDWSKFMLDTTQQSQHNEKMYVAATNDVLQDTTAAATPTTSLMTRQGPTFSSMKFSDATTIPDAIKGILESATQILALCSTKKRNNGEAVAFKILMNTTSDDNSFLIHYDVYPFYLPKVTPQKQTNQESTNSQIVPTGSTAADTRNEYQNLIGYSYLFTGKNNAIISLDVKFDPEMAVQALDTNLNIGTNRFGEVAAAGQVKTNVIQVSDGANKSSNIYTPDIRQNDPIFPAVKSKDQKNNNATQRNSEAISSAVARDALNSKQQYTQTIASVHYNSNFNLDMTVRGNPHIIEKFAGRSSRGSPPHGQIISNDQINSLVKSQVSTAVNYNKILLPTLTSAKQAYYSTFYYPRISKVLNPPKSTSTDSSDTLKNGPDIAVHPIYVLIDIRAPNIDENGNSDSNKLFTDEFFYNGIYRMLALETHFQGGEFTHSMQLIPDQGTSSQNDVPPGAK